MPGELARAEVEDGQSRRFGRQPEQQFAIRCDNGAAPRARTVLRAVQFVGPVGLDHEGAELAGQALGIDDVRGRLLGRLVGIGTHVARPEHQVDRATRQLPAHVVQVLDLAADHRRAGQPGERGDRPMPAVREKGGLGRREPVLRHRVEDDAARVDQQVAVEAQVTIERRRTDGRGHPELPAQGGDAAQGLLHPVRHRVLDDPSVEAGDGQLGETADARAGGCGLPHAPGDRREVLLDGPGHAELADGEARGWLQRVAHAARLRGCFACGMRVDLQP